MKFFSPVLLTSALATTLVFGGAIAQEPKKAEHSAAMAGHSAGSMELHRTMNKGQKMPMPMSGDVDKDFAAMMTMHHQQAIEMSEVLLKHGRDPELKALAERMKQAQQKEIADLAPFKR